MSGFGDDVEEAGVKVVEAAIRSDCRTRQSDERASREGIFGGSLGRRRLVVVRAVHEESVGRGSMEGYDGARVRATLESDTALRREAVGVHRAWYEQRKVSLQRDGAKSEVVPMGLPSP